MSHWDKTVDIETDTLGKYRMVSTTEEAARVLTSSWPKTSGPAFEAAVKACVDALQKTRDRALAAKARQAFIDAAEEADLFVRRSK
jgi:hypothetical protein